MSKITQIFFTLLRAGLHSASSVQVSNEKTTLLGYGAVTDEVWQKVYDMASDQGLTGVVFSAIEKLSKSELPPMDLLMDWLGQVEYLASSNQQYREDAADFLKVLSGSECSERLRVVVLKGVECAKFYPQPDRRSLGDLDIFCVNPNLNPNDNDGYEVVNRRCKEMGLEVDYHDYKHSKIQYKSLAIENHKFCTEIRGEWVKKEFEQELQRLLKAGLEVRGERLAKDNNALTPNALTANPQKQFEALFLIAHAFNHFIDEGLSLRQICDWAMFVKAEQDTVDWTDFYLWMEQMHMRRFADALNAIAVADLGVVITNKEIVTTSPYKDKILHEALYGHKHLHNGGLHGWQYRLAQLRIAYQDRWKYSDIMQSHWLKEYLSGVWYYFTEKEPKL